MVFVLNSSHLWQTLYVVLPAVLDSNPFLDDSQDGRRSPGNNGMEKVIYVFQSTYDLLQEVGVHPQIMSQLFAYLLFFTNASLFNMLMERGNFNFKKLMHLLLIMM